MTKVTVVNSPGIRTSDALSELTKVPEITAYGSIYGGEQAVASRQYAFRLMASGIDTAICFSDSGIQV